ncbi:MAG: hypothetical protein OEM00_06855 [Burkholderiaceae bacterium]|nr:hypothetical protein [Burkholderiaceae bacterium]
MSHPSKYGQRTQPQGEETAGSATLEAHRIMAGWALKQKEHGLAVEVNTRGTSFEQEPK